MRIRNTGSLGSGSGSGSATPHWRANRPPFFWRFLNKITNTLGLRGGGGGGGRGGAGASTEERQESRWHQFWGKLKLQKDQNQERQGSRWHQFWGKLKLQKDQNQERQGSRWHQFWGKLKLQKDQNQNLYLFTLKMQEPVCSVCQIITGNHMFSEREHWKFLCFYYATPSPNQAASELRRRSREVNTIFYQE